MKNIDQPCARICTKPGHQQILSYFCVDEQCTGDRFLCILCAYEAETSLKKQTSEGSSNRNSHSQHEIKPIKYFIRQIERDLEAIDNSVMYLAQLDDLKLALWNFCESEQLKKEPSTLQMLKIAISQYHERITQQSSIDCVLESGEILKQCNQSIFKRILQNYSKRWKQYYDEQYKNDSIYIRILKELITDLKEKIQAMREAIKKSQIGIQLVEIFKIEGGSKHYYFSPKLIHSGLTFVSKTKVKMTDYADYSYFALCQPAISMSKPQRITFSMTNLSSYITTGICIKDKIVGNYEFMSDGLGHGSYQISYDGYTWSDHDSADNSHYSGWYYNGGDKVTVEVCPKLKQVKFIKNGDEGGAKTMKFQANKNDKLHFCVTMNSEPEQIDIIQN